MLEVHEQVMREIRQWSADIVIAPRRMVSIPIIVYTGVSKVTAVPVLPWNGNAKRCFRLRAACFSQECKVMTYSDIVTIEPGKRGGKPCIRGLRITEYDVLDYLASGMSQADVLREFPYLSEEDIRACLAYAAGHGHKLEILSA